jgi:uncharacterized membrane protein
MEAHILAWGAALSFLPISELRGGIPFLVANGAAIPFAFAYCTILNALVAPVAFIFLATFHKLFLHMSWYRNLFERFVDRARDKVKKEVDKYGYWGLMVFVAIPLPVTGAWTGALGAWILGMERKKAIPVIAAGVLIAGIIVTAVVWSGAQAFSFLIKQV